MEKCLFRSTAAAMTAPAALTSNAFTRGGCVFAGWNVAGTAGQPIRNRATVGNLTNAQDAVVMLVAQWEDVDWEAEGRSGDTPDDAYLIYTTGQLDLLASRVKGGKGYDDKHFLLMADLAYDPDTDIDPDTGLATQSVTATFDASLVTEKFIKAKIEPAGE